MRDNNSEEFDPAHAAVVAIDLQHDIVGDGEGGLQGWAAPVIDGAAKLVTWARRLDCPVFWVTVERRADYADAGTSSSDSGPGTAFRTPRRLIADTPGADIAKDLVVADTDYRIRKPRVSAFHGTALDVYLRRLSIRTLVLGGVYTHMGVESTVRDAYDHDYDTVVVSDACGAPSSTLHEHAIGRVLPLLAKVRRSDQL